MRSGEIDYASGISPAQAATIAEDSDVEARAAPSGNSIMRTFALNVNVPPFDNPDVVRAVKLALDRQAPIDVILLGNGVIGNDMPSKGLAGYNDSVPQIQRDIDAARELFAGAGVDSFTLRAADVVPGLVDSADLFAQHMAEAGRRGTGSGAGGQRCHLSRPWRCCPEIRRRPSWVPTPLPNGSKPCGSSWAWSARWWRAMATGCSAWCAAIWGTRRPLAAASGRSSPRRCATR